MKRNSILALGFGVLLGVGLLTPGCGDSGGGAKKDGSADAKKDVGATGGVKGTGGSTSTGGVKGTGGAAGAGGVKGTGGVTGVGGGPGTGGTTGAGGGPGTGGVKGTGGTTGVDAGPGVDSSIDIVKRDVGVDQGTGRDAPDAPLISEAGTGSEAGAAAEAGAVDVAVATMLFDFTTTAQGWTFNTYQATQAVDGGTINVNPINLANSSNILDGGVGPTIGWDGTVGDPLGALKVTVDFTDYSQEVLANVVFSPVVNWTGKKVTIRVKVDPVRAASLADSGIVVYAQNGAPGYAMSPTVVTSFPADIEWHTITLNLDGVTGLDPATVKSLVVGIYSSDPPVPLDGGVVPAFTPASVTVYIDTIQLE